MKYPVDIEKAERTVDYIKKYSDQIGGYGGEYKHRTQNFFWKSSCLCRWCWHKNIDRTICTKKIQ